MFIQGVSSGTSDIWQSMTWLLGGKSQRVITQKEGRGSKHACLASCVNLKAIKRRLELEASFSETENPGRVERLRV